MSPIFRNWIARPAADLHAFYLGERFLVPALLLLQSLQLLHFAPGARRDDIDQHMAWRSFQKAPGQRTPNTVVRNRIVRADALIAAHPGIA
jgi:hypothetical protein